ncbi:MAG: PilN domain-containing protein [Desulfurivibrionaceae bacterium]|nr:PilN domain-containing protein [Desulfobulbales bacterium]MDT8335593.1 PilN domain-containing protein [Desulfurivibrionaceae bacterium]
MIHINLLPVRQIRARLQTRNEVAIYLALVAVVLVFVSMAALNMISTVDQLQGQSKTLTAKKASYQPILNEINKLKKDKETQQTKINVIKSLKENSQVSVRVLDEMVNLVPAGRVWLNSLRQSGKSLDVSGIALDNATIAQFMNNISASEYFSGSELASSSQTVVSGAKLKSFSLKISIN